MISDEKIWNKINMINKFIKYLLIIFFVTIGIMITNTKLNLPKLPIPSVEKQKPDRIWDRIKPKPKPPKKTVSNIGSVMILAESVNLSNEVIDYLKNNCQIDKDKNGVKTHSFRVWKNNYTEQQISCSPDIIIHLYEIAKTDSNKKLPWIVISDRKEHILISKAFPTNTEDQLEVLKKYAESK